MRMKSITTVLMASIMTLIIAGCQNTSPDTSESGSDIPTSTESAVIGEDIPAGISDSSVITTESASSTSASATDAAFEYNGKTISILDDAATMFANLGTPEADKSKNGNGTYVYDNEGITFNTCGDGDAAETSDLAVTDKTLKTSRGISVGNTKDEVIKAYNDIEAIDETDVIVYDFGNFYIKFDLDSGKNVTRIRYINNEFPDDVEAEE